MRLDTSCENCVFAKFEEGVVPQQGCEMGYMERYEEKYGGLECQSSVYKVLFNKVCPYRSYEETDPTEAFEKAIPVFNFIVAYDGNPAALKRTLSSLLRVKYFRKCNILLTYNTRNRKELVSLVERVGILPRQVRYVSILDNEAIWLDEAFKASKNGYVAWVNSGYEVPSDILCVMNHALHVDFKRVSCVRGIDNEQNLRCVMSIFAKYLRMDNFCQLESKIEALRVEQKIAEQMVFTWGELNDSYYV